MIWDSCANFGVFEKNSHIYYNKFACVFISGNNDRGPTQQSGRLALAQLKVNVSSLVVYLNQILIFEWYVLSCSSMNKDQIEWKSNEIGLHARIIISVPG